MQKIDVYDVARLGLFVALVDDRVEFADRHVLSIKFLTFFDEYFTYATWSLVDGGIVYFVMFSHFCSVTGVLLLT